MNDSATSQTVKMNEDRSRYNRDSGKKTLKLFGVLISLVVILMVATFVLFMEPH